MRAMPRKSASPADIWGKEQLAPNLALFGKYHRIKTVDVEISSNKLQLPSNPKRLPVNPLRCVSHHRPESKSWVAGP